MGKKDSGGPVNMGRQKCPPHSFAGAQAEMKDGKLVAMNYQCGRCGHRERRAN